ncbi:MAG: DUF2252 family protein [Proteobacteria bacterium]|nr:DUF2252 family protein [Pseudomonadota bacterium]MBI3498633.1 DUF2252 family protein [Pseudomonadota bacterium]
MTSIGAATRSYEAWLRRELKVREADLALKHRLMASGVLPFLRGTFYRWVSLWHERCPELTDAPSVLAVGDLHIENFGTWRDAEGRLVWGINDVDEAASMPYTIDLVRLATSAVLAAKDRHLTMSAKALCKAILKGYRTSLASGGRAFVLEEGQPALRAIALSAEREPDRYWQHLASLRPVAAPATVRDLIAAQLPGPLALFRTVRRVAGIGSLGRPRYVGIGLWHGAYVAHEAKAMLPSAYDWALDRPTARIRGAEILARAVRCPDPFLTIGDRWQLRRLGPHCSRIELAMLPERRDERHLLEAMGWETANLHLGSPKAAALAAADLERRPKFWLFEAAKRMAKATTADWQEWRRR